MPLISYYELQSKSYGENWTELLNYLSESDGQLHVFAAPLDSSLNWLFGLLRCAKLALLVWLSPSCMRMECRCQAKEGSGALSAPVWNKLLYM